jgi:hypothetical protein
VVLRHEERGLESRNVAVRKQLEDRSGKKFIHVMYKSDFERSVSAP